MNANRNTLTGGIKCKIAIRHLFSICGVLVLSLQLCNAECTNCTAISLAGLVGWWPANGSAINIADSSVGVSAGTTSFGEGLVNQSFNFQDDGMINAGNFSGLSSATELTMMAWINYAPTNSNSSGVIVAQTEGDLYASGGAFSFIIHPGPPGPHIQLHLRFSDDTGVHIAQWLEIPIAQWIHVAVTWRSYDGQIRFYLNGTNSSTQVGGASRKLAFPGAVPLTIGNEGTYGYRGQIDEVMLFKRALSDSEVQSVYSAGCSGSCLPIRIIQPPQDQILYCGSNVTFAVNATNDFGSLEYQWQFNGTNVTGATNASLFLPNLTTGQAGVYSVFVTGNPNKRSLFASANLASSILQLHRYAGVTLLGEPGQDYRIEYTDNLAPPYLWTALTNVTMSSTSYLHFDETSANAPQRYYRAVSSSCP